MGVFDDRRVTQASAYGIQFVPGEVSGVGITVSLGVSAIDGGDHGPSAEVAIFLPTAKGVSLAELQEEAVDRALDLFARIVSEDREAVKRLLYVPPKFDFQKR